MGKKRWEFAGVAFTYIFDEETKKKLTIAYR